MDRLKKIKLNHVISKKQGLLAALLSVFTVFGIAINIAPSWYNKTFSVNELAFGLTVSSGYNKEADLMVAKFLLLGLLIMFFLFIGLMYIRNNGGILSRLEQIYMLITYCFGVVMLYIDLFTALKIFGMGISIFATFFILKKGNVSLKNFYLFSFFLYLAFQSLFFVAISNANVNKYSGAVFDFAYLLLMVLLAYVLRNKNNIVVYANRILQIVIPICLLGFYRFQYAYGEETIPLFYSKKWKFFILLCMVGFVSYGIYSLMKKVDKVLFTTIFTVAAMRVFSLPSGMLNVDYFHTGEMSTLMQQFISFGKIPFLDSMPIHGLCDYYYGLINWLFFDGTYISWNGAHIVGNLFLAWFLSAVFLFFANGDIKILAIVYLTMPFLVNVAGVRYTMMFAMFFVLLAPKVRNNSFTLLYCYLLFGIATIASNMSIGGAACLAFFPMVLYTFIRCAKKDYILFMQNASKKKKGWICAAFVILGVVGVSFIPFFLKIVTYLRENTSTTSLVNGMEMVEKGNSINDFLMPSLFTNDGVNFLGVFGFVIAILVCFWVMIVVEKKEVKILACSLGVVLAVFSYVMISYAFVRFDSGYRTMILGGFLGLLVLHVLLDCSEIESYYIFTFLCLVLLIMQVNLFVDRDGIVKNKEIKTEATATIMGKEVEDPVVYIDGNSIGLEQLGTGFTTGNTLASLQNIQYVLEHELEGGSRYFDMTNAVAYYHIFNKEMVSEYSSGYNISNDLMQKNAIEQLEKNTPRLILLAPYIKFDDGTISLRSAGLYRYFIEKGYKPYQYENVIYFILGDSNLFWEANGYYGYSELMHKSALEYLPAVWASSGLMDEKEEIDTNIEIKPEATRLEIEFVEQDMGCGKVTDAYYLCIRSQKLMKAAFDKEIQVKLSFDSNCFGEVKEQNFTFTAKDELYYIPVGSSPYWSLSEEIKGVTLSILDEEVGIEILDDLEIKLYEY